MKLYDHLMVDKRKLKREKDFDILRKIRVSLPAQLPENYAASLLGPILGQYGINISIFSKQFFEKTKLYSQEVIITVIITLYRNKAFFLEIKSPPKSFLINELYNHSLLAQNIEKDELFSFFSMDFQLCYNYPFEIGLINFFNLCKFIHFIDAKGNLLHIAKVLAGNLLSMNIKIINDIKKK